MINCLIVDDEMPAREELEYLLQDFKGINIVGKATHGIEAINLNEELKPDIIFLDIKMPKINGIEVAERILNSSYAPIIVFVTAYNEFAIKAFEVNAIDYLLKPVSKESLKKIIDNINNGNSNKIKYLERFRKILKELKELMFFH